MSESHSHLDQKIEQLRKPAFQITTPAEMTVVVFAALSYCASVIGIYTYDELVRMFDSQLHIERLISITLFMLIAALPFLLFGCAVMVSSAYRLRSGRQLLIDEYELRRALMHDMADQPHDSA